MCRVSSLYAGTHDMLQNKSRSKTTVSKATNDDSSRSGQGSAGANRAGPVRFFSGGGQIVMTAQILLGTANERSISTLSRRGPPSGARHFPFASIIS